MKISDWTLNSILNQSHYSINSHITPESTTGILNLIYYLIWKSFFPSCLGEMHIGGQDHFYLETHCTIAVPKGEDGEMELFVSTQNLAKTQVSPSLDSFDLDSFWRRQSVLPPRITWFIIVIVIIIWYGIRMMLHTLKNPMWVLYICRNRILEIWQQSRQISSAVHKAKHIAKDMQTIYDIWEPRNSIWVSGILWCSSFTQL